MAVIAASPLPETVAGGRTGYCKESCAVAGLEYAIAHGGVGATSNPTIVGEVLVKEAETWLPR